MSRSYWMAFNTVHLSQCLWAVRGRVSLQIEAALPSCHECSGDCLWLWTRVPRGPPPPPPPSPVGEAPYIQSFRRFMRGNNSHEAPSLLLARMLSSFARWGPARPLGNPSWTTPPGMPPSSRGNSPSCCASNRGSSGLCGRWVPPSAPSAPVESVNTIMG